MSETEPAESKSKIAVPDDEEAPSSPAGQTGRKTVLDGPEVEIPEIAPVMAVRNTVMFPGTVTPLTVGREKSRRLLNEVLPDQKVIVLVSQKQVEAEDPSPADLYGFGTAAIVLKLLRMEAGSQVIVVHGLTRVRIGQFTQTEPFFKANVTPVSDVAGNSAEVAALAENLRQIAGRVFELSPNVPDEASAVLANIEAPGGLADFLASNLPLEMGDKQTLLETADVAGRLRGVSKELNRQLQFLELSSKIQDQVRTTINKSQRKYFLQEQLKAIQKELGHGDERTAEIEELRKKIVEAKMPDRVLREAERQLDHLDRIPQASPEYTVIRTYLDWMVEMPWSVKTADNLDIRAAERILEADHYGLQKVKKRIIEYLAVRKLAPDARGPILCFVGPPGTGKTSLGQSIARALGRMFIRISLGGCRDEAELRGHRRTYIGAMPGRVVQEIRKAGAMNPVFMLDELDKIGQDFRGDPASVLLEVLDPAQNDTFQDHYLNVPLDLSGVLFIGTANYMAPVPPALRDRMEVIELAGYTAGEKLQIARRFLLRRQLPANGLTSKQLTLTSAAMETIIDKYTREAGVRGLDRQIGAVCRGVAAMIARGTARRRTVDARHVPSYLGPTMYESEVAQRTSVPGVATGLFYTPAGGGVLFIEATRYPGNGRLTLTGQIGQVMRESAQAAFSLVRSRSARLGIDPAQIGDSDVHIHVPSGAIPKDGPSAGVAMVTALTSLLLDKPVRPDVAMTGEITLRGLVLPIGGVKHKVLAAKTAGIRTVILPRRNRKDLADVSPEARKGLDFVFVDTVTQVLRTAMKDRPVRRRKGKAAAKAK